MGNTCTVHVYMYLHLYMYIGSYMRDVVCASVCSGRRLVLVSGVAPMAGAVMHGRRNAVLACYERSLRCF